MSANNYVVIEGVVEDLEVFDVHVQFLNNAKKKQRTAGIAATIQAATGQPSAVHSAQAAGDSGDPVEGFRMSLGNQAVAGSFWQTTFRNGDWVQAIGEMQGSVFKAIAVVSPAAGTIWMQPHCERGTLAKKRHLIKYSIVFAVAVFIIEAILLRNVEIPIWLLFITSIVAVATILVVTVGMSWKDFMGFAMELNKVGNALKAKNPEEMDLIFSTKKLRKQGKPDLPMGVFYL